MSRSKSSSALFNALISTVLNAFIDFISIILLSQVLPSDMRGFILSQQICPTLPRSIWRIKSLVLQDFFDNKRQKVSNAQWLFNSSMNNYRFHGGNLEYFCFARVSECVWVCVCFVINRWGRTPTIRLIHPFTIPPLLWQLYDKADFPSSLLSFLFLWFRKFNFKFSSHSASLGLLSMGKLKYNKKKTIYIYIG